MSTLWNPGEFVWDQTTGEPYIDPETGDAVEARPGLLIATPNGRTIDGDDVVSAVFWATNLFEGEAQRARGVGVPYQRKATNPGLSPDLALTLVLGEALRVRGVGAILSSRLVAYSPRSRALTFAGVLKKRDGVTIPLMMQSG